MTLPCRSTTRYPSRSRFMSRKGGPLPRMAPSDTQNHAAQRSGLCNDKTNGQSPFTGCTFQITYFKATNHWTHSSVCFSLNPSLAIFFGYYLKYEWCFKILANYDNFDSSKLIGCHKAISHSSLGSMPASCALQPGKSSSNSMGNLPCLPEGTCGNSCWTWI